MNDDPPSSPSPAPSRLTVGLDGSPHSQAALDAAVRLASRFEAEVRGLFVEDEQLLRAAELPFAAEVRVHSRPPRRLSGPRVERQLRYQAERAEAAFQRTADQAGVEHSFEIVRGRVRTTLLTATDETDLLALGKTSTASSRHRLGSTTESVVAEADSPVLVLRAALAPQQPILTHFDGSPQAERALQWAVQVAQGDPPTALTVLLPPGDADTAARLQEAVHAQCAHAGVPLQVHVLTDTEEVRLPVLARRSGEGLVVLPVGCAPLQNDTLQHFLYELDRPALFVR